MLPFQHGYVLDEVSRFRYLLASSMNVADIRCRFDYEVTIGLDHYAHVPRARVLRANVEIERGQSQAISGIFRSFLSGGGPSQLS